MGLASCAGGLPFPPCAAFDWFVPSYELFSRMAGAAPRAARSALEAFCSQLSLACWLCLCVSPCRRRLLGRRPRAGPRSRGLGSRRPAVKTLLHRRRRIPNPRTRRRHHIPTTLRTRPRWNHLATTVPLATPRRLLLRRSSLLRMSSCWRYLAPTPSWRDVANGP